MTILFTGSEFLDHETGRHPETPRRIGVLLERLRDSPVPRGELRSADDKALLRAHDEELLEQLKQIAAAGGGRIDADTVMSRHSLETARLAAGTAMEAVDQVIGGEHSSALCLIRPPGHHATPERSMGFCLFNNVAVAALHAIAQHELQRVLIVDWDVHHGNGTQDIFYADPRVTFFSAHRHPFYPGTGMANETGTGDGRGTTFNLPLPFGISRQEYREAFANMLTDAAERCRPELVLVSAGFDAHRDDPIGSLGLESEDFGTLTELVQQVAEQHCGGRIVSLLEGGYNLEALAESVQIHLDQLARGSERKRNGPSFPGGRSEP